MEFTYHNKLSPIVGVVLALACAEAFVLHIIAMALWGWNVAILIGIADALLIVMLVQKIRSFSQCPIHVRDGIVTMRTGRRMCVHIAADNIAGFRSSWRQEDVKGRHVLNMALVVWPTTVFDLKEPIRRRGKSITTIAHCVDEPENFRRAVRQLIASEIQELPIA